MIIPVADKPISLKAADQFRHLASTDHLDNVVLDYHVPQYWLDSLALL